LPARFVVSIDGEREKWENAKAPVRRAMAKAWAQQELDAYKDRTSEVQQR